jgi:hypothetical protein
MGVATGHQNQWRRRVGYLSGGSLNWPALSDGRTGEGVFGRFLMGLVVFGSF